MSVSKRVLVVDDDNIGLMLIGQYLERTGHTFVTASNGQIAWEILDGGAMFDLVISDYQMPKRNGVELRTMMRADIRMADTPFALMSGMDVSVDSRPLAVVCDDLDASFISKPFVGFASQLARLLGGDKS